jgi:hypothetical protein
MVSIATPRCDFADGVPADVGELIAGFDLCHSAILTESRKRSPDGIENLDFFQKAFSAIGMQ